MVNTYDVIQLDKPIPEGMEITIDELLEAICDVRFQRIGKPVGIIKILEGIAESISDTWEELSEQYLLNHISPTSFTYINKPLIVPFASEIDHVYESNNATPDSPMNEIENLIVFDYGNEEPASLSRRKYGPLKEYGSRLRFYFQNGDQQWPVKARRREYIVTFKTYAHSRILASLYTKALDYYFEIKKEVLLGLGVQHHHVQHISHTMKDNKTGMLYRELQLYMRAEEWFMGEAMPMINEISMNWYQWKS